MDLSGHWRSEYTYISGDLEHQSEHTVALKQEGWQITGDNLPADDHDSVLHIRLTRRDNELYGQWQEKTDSTGVYQGVVFDGMLHLVVSPDGNSLIGKWTGLSRHNVVKAGDWTFSRIA